MQATGDLEKSQIQFVLPPQKRDKEDRRTQKTMFSQISITMSSYIHIHSQLWWLVKLGYTLFFVLFCFINSQEKKGRGRSFSISSQILLCIIS